MRRRDKLKNIEKANMLTEQRYLKSKGLLKEDWEEDAYGQDYDSRDPGGYEPTNGFEGDDDMLEFDSLHLVDDIDIVGDVTLIGRFQGENKPMKALGQMPIPKGNHDLHISEDGSAVIDFSSNELSDKLLNLLNRSKESGLTHHYYSAKISPEEVNKILNAKETVAYEDKSEPKQEPHWF